MSDMTDEGALDTLRDAVEWNWLDDDAPKDIKADILSAIDYIAARLREPAGVPEGWVLVPREKLEQVADGIFSKHHSAEENKDVYDVAYFGAMLKDVEEMLASAPQPPAEAQAQGGGEVVAEVKEVDVYEQHGRGWHKDARILPTGHMPDVGTKLYTAPPSAPVGVEASYHPCTSILIEGLKRLEGGTDVLEEWDRARAKADTTLAPKPAAVDGAWLVKARELYDRCSLFPENTTDGFMALLELRNHVHSILAAQPGGSDNNRQEGA